MDFLWRAEPVCAREPDYSRKLVVRMKILVALTARRSGRRIRGAYASTEVLQLAKDRYGAAGSRAAIAHAGRGVKSERPSLALLLAAAGCLFVVGVLTTNVGSTLLSLAAGLACATRIERNHRQGEYGHIPPEKVE